MKTITLELTPAEARYLGMACQFFIENVDNQHPEGPDYPPATDKSRWARILAKILKGSR